MQPRMASNRTSCCGECPCPPPSGQGGVLMIATRPVCRSASSSRWKPVSNSSDDSSTHSSSFDALVKIVHHVRQFLAGAGGGDKGVFPAAQAVADHPRQIRDDVASLRGGFAGGGQRVAGEQPGERGRRLQQPDERRGRGRHFRRRQPPAAAEPEQVRIGCGERRGLRQANRHPAATRRIGRRKRVGIRGHCQLPERAVGQWNAASMIAVCCITPGERGRRQARRPRKTRSFPGTPDEIEKPGNLGIRLPGQRSQSFWPAGSWGASASARRVSFPPRCHRGRCPPKAGRNAHTRAGRRPRPPADDCPEG